MPLLRRSTLTLTLVAATAALLLTSCAAPEAEPAPTEAPAETLTVGSIAALGDSLTVGVNSCDTQGACPEASWATGTRPEVESVAARVAEATGTEPAVVNAARDGARSGDLAEQVAAAVEADPDLYLVLMGSNDICSPTLDGMTSVDDYRANIAAALDAITTGSPDATVFLASVPDIARLGEAVGTDPAAAAVWSRSDRCATITAMPEAVDQVRSRIMDFNAVLAEECAAATRCMTDGGALFDVALTPDQISTIDYFHVSLAGQHTIAETVWGKLSAAITP